MLKISNIRLSSGIEFAPASLTVVIGPNNGGKSRFLRDIRSKITMPNASTPSLLSADIDVLPTWHAALDKMASHLNQDERGGLIFDRLGVDLISCEHVRYTQSMIQAIMVPSPRQSTVEQQANALGAFGGLFLANLGTPSRLELVKRQTSSDSNTVGPGSVAEAMKQANENDIRWINDQVRGAFGRDLIVDNSKSFEIGLVLGDNDNLPTHFKDREKSLEILPRTEDQGDGVKAFCGIVAAVATTDRSVILIDEPEAFLHPPQALLIGRALARLEKRGAQVFVATHSAEVLRGVIGENQKVQVLRLSQTDSGFHSKLIAAEDLEEISTDPLLSSARVLDGLFYRGVVIAESDSDAAIYRRILEDMDGTGSVHFLNAYGKSATIKMTAPYRTMGIGHAVIVDFDILRDETEYRRLIEALGGEWESFKGDYQLLLSEIELSDEPDNRLYAARMAVQEVVTILESGLPARERLDALPRHLRNVRDKASTWSALKRLGREGLSQTAKSIFDRLEKGSAAIGLFIVPCGERESWLPGIVDYTGNKSFWTEAALTALSQNRIPRDHAIRQFVERVRSFVLA